LVVRALGGAPGVGRGCGGALGGGGGRPRVLYYKQQASTSTVRLGWVQALNQLLTQRSLPMFTDDVTGTSRRCAVP
jgi:hypothetical protein